MEENEGMEESEVYFIDRTALKKQAKILLDKKTLAMVGYFLVYLLIVETCAAFAFLVPNPIENVLLGFNALITPLFYINAVTYYKAAYIVTGVAFILFRCLVFSAIIYPFSVCWATIPLCVVNGEKITWSSIVAPISRARYFIELVIMGAMRSALVFVWGLLFFAPAVVANYRYEMALFIFAKKHEMTSSEAIKASDNLSCNFKKYFFTRDLSFLGWLVVGVCTCGIVLLWVTCYYWVLKALYFKNIASYKNMVFEDEKEDVANNFTQEAQSTTSGKEEV